MTQESSLTTVELDYDPTNKTKFTVECLEFGKFCVSPDGPIESNRDNIPIEHSQLGWSSEFPKELIPTCYPTKIGIAQEDGESRPHDNDHGTVLRSTVRGDEKKLWPILYRVKSRSEEGEGLAGRHYTIARYLVSSELSADPRTLLAAMDASKLRGITRAEADHISSIGVNAARLELDAVGEAFLSEALIYVLSGIPLSITEEISEEQFFTWVAAVYARLPPALRPHLSAGWNVGSSYSGKLGITYTTHRAASTALFSPTALKWSSPEFVTTWNAQHQPVAHSFFQSRLEPGRLFEEYVLLQTTNESSSVSQRLSDLVGALPRLDLPELPDWQDATTVRMLRYPGLQARDQFALAALERWLTDEEEDPRLCLDARKLNYPSNKVKALGLILNALVDPDSRPRADRALWLSVSGKAPSAFTNLINAATGVGAERARFMAALGSDEVSETLRALVIASSSAVDNLSDEIAENLFAILDRSMTPKESKCLPFHTRLLQCPPVRYRQWVERHALELMRVLATSDETPEQALATIVEIDGSDTAKAILQVIRSHEPPANLPALLQPFERGIFVELFNQEWAQADEKTAERREVLLRWFRLLKPTANRHALLRLESNEDLTESQVEAVADDVEAGYVPESLLTKVAVLALKRWAIIGRRIRSRARAWISISSLWPLKYARALVAHKGAETPSPEIVRAAEELKVPYADLQDLIYARYDNDKATFNGMAAVLWDLALRLGCRHSQPISIVDLCNHFAAAILPNGQIAAADPSIFEKLAKESGRLKLPSKAVQGMWATAEKPWQIGLVLALFPQEDLAPTPLQLSALIPYEDWLNPHLNDSKIHPHRRNRFLLATKGFHSLSYKDDYRWWREDFVQHPIWAAFKGVPVSILPPEALRQALRPYSQSDNRPTAEQSEDILKRQAQFCCTFLDSYSGAASEDLALLRVLNEFLLPLLSYHSNRKTLEVLFNWIGAEEKFPDYKSTNDPGYPLLHEVKELMRRIARSCNQKVLMRVIQDFYKNPKYAYRDRNK